MTDGENIKPSGDLPPGAVSMPGSTVVYYNGQPAKVEEVIDIFALWQIVWSSKWIIGVLTSAFAAISVAIALGLPNIYRSEVLLAPAVGENKGPMSGLASQFGGLASLAGIDLGGTGTDKTVLALQVLQSRSFITAY